MSSSSFPDCCSNIYHLHQHKFEFHNASAAQVFNATLKELLETIVCGKVVLENDAAPSPSSGTKIATTAVSMIFLVLCFIAVAFMLFAFVKSHINGRRRRRKDCEVIFPTQEDAMLHASRVLEANQGR